MVFGGGHRNIPGIGHEIDEYTDDEDLDTGEGDLTLQKQASSKPITTGRWDEEERILRNRFQRPRLFRFVERSPPSAINSSTTNIIIYNDLFSD